MGMRHLLEHRKGKWSTCKTVQDSKPDICNPAPICILTDVVVSRADAARNELYEHLSLNGILKFYVLELVRCSDLVNHESLRLGRHDSMRVGASDVDIVANEGKKSTATNCGKLGR